MVVFLFLLVRFCAGALSPSAPGIVIYGPSFTQPLFHSLDVAYLFSHSDKVEYQTVTKQEDYAPLLASGRAVILSSFDNITLPDSALTFPLFGFPLVLVYNLNNAPSLNLSQQVLVDIFLGRITRWNDGNLTALNQNLPDQPIILIIDSLHSHFTEGLSVLAGYNVDNSFVLSNATVQVGRDVAAEVKITPYSLGFSWLADALVTGAKTASLQNKEGFYARPNTGVRTALGEFGAVKEEAGESAVLPHNMLGRLSWPLIGLVYLILPSQTTCVELQIFKEWVSLVMFSTTTDRLARVLGWEPISGQLSLSAHALGSLSYTFDYRDQLNSISCETVAEHTDLYHTLGATSVGQLWSFALEVLVAYSQINPFFDLSASDTSVTTLLDAMVLGHESGLDIDVTLTFEPVLDAYPEILRVPAFMASLAPVVNLGFGVSLILSTDLLTLIFCRNITRWDDVRIKNLNPDVALPAKDIIVFADHLESKPDEAPNLFDPFLRKSSAYTRVDPTTNSSTDLVRLVQFTNYSIGYGYGHTVGDAFNLIPRLLGSSGKPIALSAASLYACWNSSKDPDCWPLAIILELALRRPYGKLSCKHQKPSVDFVNWILHRDVYLDELLVPNPRPESMGEAEYCGGRSLLVTHPEPQEFPEAAVSAIYAMSGIGMIWAVCQAIALGVARNNSALKSASVLFSLLAVVGVFLMLITPFLIVNDNLSSVGCGAGIWLLCLGFSLTFGSLFAKLFRLYKIFTSRSLVVPRLSSTKLFLIVAVFLAIDFVLLLIYSVVSAPTPSVYSSKVLSEIDLATGYREFTWTLCSFDASPALILLAVLKNVMALGGATMAFLIRQVDRRFSAISALGGSFYNLFLTELLAVILMVFFQSGADLSLQLFIPVVAGLWIIFITLIALTLDSNVLLACKDLTGPILKLLSSTKGSKHSKQGSNGSTSAKDAAESESGSKKSSSSSGFVVNREMFPSKYDPFDGALLEQILEELNFQRLAVRRALAALSSNLTAITSTVELPELGRATRVSTHTPKMSKIKPGVTSDIGDLKVVIETAHQRSSATSMLDDPPDKPSLLNEASSSAGGDPLVHAPVSNSKSATSNDQTPQVAIETHPSPVTSEDAPNKSNLLSDEPSASSRGDSPLVHDVSLELPPQDPKSDA